MFRRIRSRATVESHFPVALSDDSTFITRPRQAPALISSSVRCPSSDSFPPSGDRKSSAEARGFLLLPKPLTFCSRLQRARLPRIHAFQGTPGYALTPLPD